MDEAAAGRRDPAEHSFDASLWHLPAEPAFGLVKIPAGAFRMDGGGQPHQVELPDFWIARFPTTVAQFRAFVSATGFAPGAPEWQSGGDDHPVNWVSWYEAMAYCGWLEHELAAHFAAIADDSMHELATHFAAIADESMHVSLPSEAEWEKAALSVSGAAYPWGDEFDARRCNTKETGIGTTTPVGSFPEGASPYGLLDMSGNVWCYLRTVWGPSLEKPLYRMPYDANDGREDVAADPALLRCARGGAFTVEPERAKSTFRDAIPTDSRDDADGFRIVVSSQAALLEKTPS